MNILLVRLRLIGDVVFTTPLLRAIRRHYPAAHITYLVEPTAAPVVTANPHLDEVMVIPKANGLSRLRDDFQIARRLRHGRFDIAVDFHGGPRAAWLTWASRAPMRIGYEIRGRAWMYTHPIARPDDLAPRHAVTNQWDLLAPLDIPPGRPDEDPVEMPQNREADQRVHQHLARIGVTAEHPVIVIHVSAGNRFRRWPHESFVALVEQLVRRNPRRRIVLTSGPSDSDAVHHIANIARQRLGPLGIAVPEVDEVGLPELRSLIARASVYVGGDSGPLHIAATTATPIVALFGPTLAERSMPWRSAALSAEYVDAGPLICRPCRQRVCAPGDFRCLTSISPDRVAAAVERVGKWGQDSMAV